MTALPDPEQGVVRLGQTKIDGVLFLFGILLLISLASPAGYVGDDRQLEQDVNSQYSVSYDDHSRIVISGDADFATQASAEGWAGNGSSTAPYIIEGYNITDNQMCIWIQHVSVYFTVRDCFINSSTIATDPGIYLNNVSHARVEEVFITWHTYAIYANLCPDVVIDGCNMTKANAVSIWLVDCDGAVLSNCNVYDNEYRIAVQGSDHVLIQGNQIHDNGMEGLWIQSSDFVTIVDNTIARNGVVYDDTGVYLWMSDNATVLSNYIHDSGREGIQIYVSDNATVSGNFIYRNGIASSESGISLYTSNHTTIFENELYDNGYTGVYIDDSNYVIVQSNNVYGNPDYGIDIAYECTFVEVRDNDLWENGYGGFGDHGGVYVDTSYECLIEVNRMWNNSVNGIYLISSHDCAISGNSIWNNTEHGINAVNTYSVDVIGNLIWGNGWKISTPVCGIHASSCWDWQIVGNTIWNNTEDGVFFDGMGVAHIVGNSIYDNSRHGIALLNGGPYVVDDNVIHHNKNTGILVNVDSYANITDNVVYDNSIGVYIMTGSSGWIRGNDIGWNTLENALDITGPDANCWHNNESIGNWWSDYSGVGPYGITNGTGFENYDLYPHKSLDLNASASIGYEFGTTGNVMVWPAQARNPSYFEVYTNNSLLYSAPWDGTDIDAVLDGLAVAYYFIKVTAYHISGHHITVGSFLTVSDTTAPTWVTLPSDQEIDEGEPFSYQVTATDLSGIASYSVNDTVHFQVSVTGLITNKTPLEAGVYALVVTADDPYGTDTNVLFRVTVRDITAPSWVAVPTDQETTTDEPFSYQVTATDLSGIASYSVNDTVHFHISVTGLITNATALDVGVYYLNITAIDTWGNELSAVITVTVTDVTAPSWVTLPTDQEVTVGVPFSYQVTATDPSGIGGYSVNDTVHFHISVTGLITNATALDVGVYYLNITAIDTYGNELTAVITVTVTDITAPSWVTLPTDQEVTAGEPFSYQVTATDASGIGSYSVNDTVHFHISATGVITNASVLEPGVYGLEITATDIYGNELTVVITVTVIAVPPVDNTLLIVAAAGAGAVIVVVALLVLMRKKTG